MKNGIIFGKFYPLHLGHVNFIQKCKEKVDKLYVVLCFDKDRDKKLFEETGKKIKSEWRYNILKEEFSNDAKIEILVLDETGIIFYPCGWEEWSNAVDKMLTEHNVNIDVVFTNEIKDVENYKKYFKNLQNTNDNFEVVSTDVDRDEVHISATEIRKNLFIYIIKNQSDCNSTLCNLNYKTHFFYFFICYIVIVHCVI